jgi:nitroreductase
MDGLRKGERMDAIEALRTRQSARALKEPAPAGAALEALLESAVRAPDHGRLRPWAFILIESEKRAAFGDLLAGQMRRTKPTATPDALERERQKAFRAPLIIVVAAVPTPSAKIPQIEQVLSAAAAAQSVMLAAYAQGFNAMWKTGDAAYDDEVKRALGLAPKDSIVGFLYVGTEDGEPSTLPRPSWREHTRVWDGPVTA